MMVFVHIDFMVIPSPTQLESFNRRVCHPEFKNLSSRLQSNSLNIVINITVDFKPVMQEQRGNRPSQLH